MSLGKSFGSPGGDPTHYNTLHTQHSHLGRWGGRGLQALSRGGWELGAGGRRKAPETTFLMMGDEPRAGPGRWRMGRCGVGPRVTDLSLLHLTGGGISCGHVLPFSPGQTWESKDKVLRPSFAVFGVTSGKSLRHSELQISPLQNVNSESAVPLWGRQCEDLCGPALC